jgi:hypothetical protein
MLTMATERQGPLLQVDDEPMMYYQGNNCHMSSPSQGCKDNVLGYC